MKWLHVTIALAVFAALAVTAPDVFAAYHHQGEADAPNFLAAYPDKAGTKLDNCALCHSGGTTTSGTKTTTYGSCQWCHFEYGYAGTGDITATLNSYGKDYLANGRSQAALKLIESLDSDGDGYSNITEINAIRYPGDANDDPTKVVASYRIFTKAQLQAMPQHSQFLLMNTTKSGDYYAEYSGVIMQDLLKKAGMATNATQITVYAPDGFSQRHPLDDSASNLGSSYAPYVNGTYPAATYYYNAQADKINGGWCDYSSPGTTGRNHGDQISVNGDLRLILALQADGKDLVPGYLDSTNKLANGTEGPFRIVTPQKIVGPPDQASTATNQSVIWPYDGNADHNAGFSSKSATIIKVEPLPAGTTDINVLESGWGYVDQEKIIIYGDLEGPAIVTPINGATQVSWKATRLAWTKFADTDPTAKVNYTVEISTDQTTWTTVATQVASTGKSMKTLLARFGNGNFLFFGLFGVIAVGAPRRSRKYLCILLLIASSGLVISSCGGGGSGSSNTVSTSTTLAPSTTYYWRVTADGPNSHAVSTVSSFTTGK